MKYQTVREAGIAGVLAALPLSRTNRWEYGGAILINPDGTYTPTEAHTDKEIDSVAPRLAIPPKVRNLIGEHKSEKEFREFYGRYVAGHYHTHVLEGRDYKLGRSFSANDLMNAMAWTELSYLGLTTTEEVYEIDARTRAAFYASQFTDNKARELSPDRATEMLFIGQSLYDLVGAPPVWAIGKRVYNGIQGAVSRDSLPIGVVA